MAKIMISDLFRAYLTAKKESTKRKNEHKPIALVSVNVLSRVLANCDLEIDVSSDLLVSSAIFFPKTNKRMNFEKIAETIKLIQRGQLLHIYFSEKSSITNLRVLKVIKSGKRREISKILFAGGSTLHRRLKPSKGWLFSTKETLKMFGIELGNIEISALKLSAHSKTMR